MNTEDTDKMNSRGRDLYIRHCTYLPAMAGWFACSAALSAYNKVIFGAKRGAFPCPLLLTSIHFLVQWTFSYSVSSAFPNFFGGNEVKAMSWKKYLSVSIPCGLVTALDVGLSNLSLVRISITFFTMVKSSAPLWVLISAFTFGIEKVTCNLITVGAMITGGELLTALGETEFDTLGFLMCLGAAICGGIRWTLVQFKLQKLDPPLRGSVATMRVLSSSMFFSMLFFSLVIERPWVKLGPEGGGNYFEDANHAFKTISLGLIGAFIAIAMVLCEFWLILKSNAIVLMIGGVLKELITIVVGVVAFGDELNAINISGICVVFMGVALYKITLVFTANEKETPVDNASEMDNGFAPVHAEQIFAAEPDPYGRAMGRALNGKSSEKNSDPDLALMSAARFQIDDDDDFEESSLSGSSFREEENGLPGIT